MSNLITPTIPFEFLHDFFTHAGGEAIGHEIQVGASSKAMARLFDVIVSFNEVKQAYDVQGGRLTPDQNERAVNLMFGGWSAMRELGAIK